MTVGPYLWGAPRDSCSDSCGTRALADGPPSARVPSNLFPIANRPSKSIIPLLARLRLVRLGAHAFSSSWQHSAMYTSSSSVSPKFPGGPRASNNPRSTTCPPVVHLPRHRSNFDPATVHIIFTHDFDTRHWFRRN